VAENLRDPSGKHNATLKRGERAWREACDYREHVLRTSPDSLRDRVERLIVEGVECGLVVLDPKARLAMALMPDDHRPWEPWDQQAGRDSIPLCIASTRDAPGRRRRLAVHRVVEDLDFALRDGWAQSVALRALGEPLDQPKVGDAAVALSVVRELSLVANGWGAPPDVIARASPWLRAIWKHAQPTERIEPWMVLLSDCMALQLPLLKAEGHHGASLVSELLNLFLVAASDAPPPFRAQACDRMNAAGAYLDGVRLRGTVAWQSALRRRGPGFSPWRIAKGFAECFRVNMPSERDARRVWHRVVRGGGAVTK
jgi:hypothetical protein